MDYVFLLQVDRDSNLIKESCLYWLFLSEFPLTIIIRVIFFDDIQFTAEPSISGEKIKGGTSWWATGIRCIQKSRLKYRRM